MVFQDSADAEPAASAPQDDSLVHTVARRAHRFVKPDIPLAVRVMQVINVVVLVVFANPVMRFVIDVSGLVAAVIVITSVARNAADAVWFSVLVVALCVAMVIALAMRFARIAEVITRLQVGPPVFGELGGTAKHLVRTAVKASKELRFKLTDDDAEFLDAHMALILKGDEATLRKSFTQLATPEGEEPLSAEELDAEWKRVWQRELLGLRVGEATLREAYGRPSYAITIIPTRLAVVGPLVGPILLALQNVLLVLVFLALTGGGSYLTVFQVALVVTFVVTAIIYLNHVKSFALLTVLPPEPYLQELSDDVAAKLKANAGTQIVPIQVTATPAYFSAIRNFFARCFAITMTFNALVLLAMLLVTYVVAIVVGKNSSHVTSTYVKLALAIALIPVAVVATLYVASLLIQHVRNFAAIVVGGLVTALAPVLLAYFGSGELPSDTRTIVTAAVAGVVGTFATALGTFVKDRVGGSPQAAKT